MSAGWVGWVGGRLGGSAERNRISGQRSGRRLFGRLLMVVGLTSGCLGQLCSTAHVTDLYCLIPVSFHTGSAPFNALFTPFGTELAELPTARPAGLVLRFEHGLLVPSTESLGAIFTDRAETLGRRRVFVGFSYQSFTFDHIDGLPLGQVPIVLYDPGLRVNTVTESRFDIRVGQYVALGAVGVTNRLDLSIAMPFERVSLGTSISGGEYGVYGGTAPVLQKVAGSSNGMADITLGAKELLLDRGRLRAAAGVDVRLPSGDELNFLGSGTPGVRPYLAVSTRGRISPHLNLGYQWNGKSILNTTATGRKQRLPTDLFYTAGINVEASRRWTFVADLLGRHFYDSPRLQLAVPFAIPNYGVAPGVEGFTGGYTTTDLSLGFKSAVRRLIVSGNVTLKLNDGGLRARAVPLGGVSYTF